MKRLLFFLSMFIFCSNLFSAVKVGDSFVALNGDTYRYFKVVIDGTSYDIEVNLIKCVQTGHAIIPETVVDNENYNCKVVGIYNGSCTSKDITAITLPNTLRTISPYAFGGSQIEELHIPASVSSIGSGIGTKTFKSFVVDENNPYYCSDANGVLFTKDMRKLICYPAGRDATDYSVPEGVTEIFTSAFYFSHIVNLNLPSTLSKWKPYYNHDNFNSLKNINVDPANLTYYSIDGVFCERATNKLIMYPMGKDYVSYTVPEPIEEIAEYGIYGNGKIQEIILGPTVKKLDSGALNLLNGLRSITLSKNITDITSGNPFVNCKNLANINVADDNEEYMSIDGVLYDKSGETLITYPLGHGANYTVPDGTKYIAERAFNSVPISDITFPSTLVSIGTEAFLNCSSLGNVVFSNAKNFKTIGEKAFTSCTKLTSISLPSSTETIQSAAFTGTAITYFKVPESTTTIGSMLFMAQDKLRTVEFNTNITNVGSSAFKLCNSLENVIFPEDCHLTSIPDYAFEGDKLLQSIIIPSTVTSIGTSAFIGCSDLENVTFQEVSSLTTIKKGAFQDSGITSITIPEATTTIEENAFTNCTNLNSVYIPTNVTTIDYSTFTHCVNLTKINVSKDNSVYSSSDGILLTKDKKTLVIFPAGKANSRFTLLPPSITKIGKLSFYDCENLVNVTIPKKVTTIETRAFYFCPNLKYIAMLGKPATVGTEAFDDGSAAGYSDIKSRATLYVRTRDLTDYKSSEFWKEFPNIETSFENNTEEFLPMSDTYVNMVNSKSNVHSLIIPSTATDTNGKTYHVGLIGDYAFEENDGGKLKEVITFENVEYIGAKAFKQASSPSIKNIIFVQKEPQAQLLSTYRFELMPEDLPGGNDDQYMELDKTYQHIYVRRSDTPQCKVNWPKYENVITYEIPTTGEFNIIPSAENGTFSREFAVDLSNNGRNTVDEGNRGLLAFVPGERFKISDTEYNIRMYSINEGGDGDGTYIPAGTGVLLRKYSDNMPSYYEIAENQSSAENPMTQSVVINSGTIPASTTTTYNFYIGKSDGLAHKATKTTNIGVHRAYLSIPIDSDNTSAAKKVTFSFADPASTTDINEVMSTAVGNNQWYNINGQRVISPSKGLYIRNGKKVVVK